MEERQRCSLFAGAVLLTTIAAEAQSPAGLLTGMPPHGILTSTLSSGEGTEVMLRVSGDSYRGIGTYVPPAAHQILGARIRLRDASLADGELFDVHVYLEAGQSNLPTIPGPAAPGTTAVASVRDVTTPSGIADHEVDVLFPAPVDVPIGVDLFVSVHFRSPGLQIRTVGGTSVPGIVTSLLDNCGPGLPQDESFAYRHDLGFVAPLGSGTIGWQPLVELLVAGSCGVAVSARDAQTPPTASMYSGLHPDSAVPSHQPSRRDLPGYLFRSNGVVAEGTPVFLLGSTQPFAWQPWIVLSPGNAVLHLSPIGLVGLTMATVGQDGTALMLWYLPPTNAVRGLDIRTQAFAFDPATSSVAAGAAVRQRF